jgi:hypothetical protein
MNVGSFSINSSWPFMAANNRNEYAFGTQPFTIEAWIKTYDGGPIVGKTALNGPGSGFFLEANPGTIKLGTSDGTVGTSQVT